MALRITKLATAVCDRCGHTEDVDGVTTANETPRGWAKASLYAWDGMGYSGVLLCKHCTTAVHSWFARSGAGAP